MEQEIGKKELFETTPVPRAVMTLAIPTILSSLVMVIYNLADTYFVGMLNSPVQTAAVTLAAPLLLAFNAVNNLFGVGSSSMMSRALGRQDRDTACRSAAFGSYCALICGLLFSLAYTSFRTPILQVLGTDSTTVGATSRYLRWTVTCGAAPAIVNVVMAYLVRSEGASAHASIGTMSGCVLNIILDPIFVLPWGLDMGAAGAGCATFISNCVACLYFLILCFVKRKDTCVSLRPAHFLPRKPIVKGVFVVGVPACVQNLLNVTGMTILNNFAAAYGADAVAAIGIAQKVNMIPMYIVLGLSQGVTPLIGYNFASGDSKRMNDAILFAVKIALAFLLAMTVGYYIGAGKIIRLFMEDANIVAYGTKLLRGMCLGMVFLAMDFVVVGVFQACGMGGKAFLFAVLRKLVLEIPAIIILDHFFPLYGLGYSQLCAEVIMSVIAIICLVRIFRKNTALSP